MKSSLVITAIISLFICIAIVVWKYSNQEKIGFVRTQELVYGFDGTKEVQAKFNTKKLRWQSKYDSLQKDFEKELALYNRRFNDLSEQEIVTYKNKLNSKERLLKQQAESITRNIEIEDAKMMEGVVNQINSFVKSYAETEDYNIILGTTSSGNIMYAKPELDITEVVLKELNTYYIGDSE